MANQRLNVSAIVGSRLVDGAGAALGRVNDVIVRLDSGDRLPPVSGLKSRIGGRDVFVPGERIAKLEASGTRLSTTKLNLAQFERRRGELLLRSDLLGRAMIHIPEARLVRASEIELECEDGRWHLLGIDPSLGARLRRLLPRRYRAAPPEDSQLLPWPELEPFVAHVPTARLRLRRIARMHPAQIADLVEAASHEEGEEILEAVGHDRELEADVFEELDDEHQLEFLRERSDAEVAAVLAEMASDDAADLLLGLEQERRIPVLELMPPGRQRKIRALLGYNPSTAGGVMTPDFLNLPETASVDEALAAVRASELEPELLQVVYVHDGDGRLLGAVPLATLIRANSKEAVGNVTEPGHPSVSPDADIPELARLMTDYNLISMPVVDGDGRPLGAVTVDDVLELTLPSDWRRRYGVARS
jgi:CBS domain-containing protein